MPSYTRIGPVFPNSTKGWPLNKLYTIPHINAESKHSDAD